jgi:hypothetical protein
MLPICLGGYSCGKSLGGGKMLVSAFLLGFLRKVGAGRGFLVVKVW